MKEMIHILTNYWRERERVIEKKTQDIFEKCKIFIWDRRITSEEEARVSDTRETFSDCVRNNIDNVSFRIQNVQIIKL